MYIFLRVFKSQATNVDTICSIMCHFMNTIFSNFTSSQGQPDKSFDVQGNLDKNQGGGGKGKKGKKQEVTASIPPSKKAFNLSEFLRGLLESIVKNSILKDQSAFFGMKKKVQSQIDFIRAQFKEAVEGKTSEAKKSVMSMDEANLNLAGLDNDSVKEKVPAIRFSEEVQVLISILLSCLRKLPT